MNRRKFIKTFILLNIATASSWYFIKSIQVQSFLENLLKSNIIDRIGIEYYDEHVVALFIRDSITYNKYSNKRMYAYRFYEVTGFDYSSKIQNSYERFSKKILEQYILSTNILLDESKVSYRLYYDPYVNFCSNFLAEFDHA